MNKRSLFFFALLSVATLGFSSCRTQRANVASAENLSDAQTTRTYDLGSFDRMRVSGVSTIHFTQGPQQSVTAKAGADELNRTKIYVQDGCLYVKHVGVERVQQHQGCDIYVTASALSSLHVSGVCTFKADKLKANSFDLNISGVANFSVPDFKCDDTRIQISGVATVKTSIEGDNLNVKSSGVSNAEINFKGKMADINSSGVGNLTVDLECDEVKARNSGQATLRLKGQADKTNVDNSGIATVDTSDLNQY